MVLRNLNNAPLMMAGAGSALLSGGFATIYLLGLRKRGFEAGGDIWWNSLRPVHAATHGIFALAAINNVNVWWVLPIDASIGFAAWVEKRIL